jgi:hypothetical protein
MVLALQRKQDSNIGKQSEIEKIHKRGNVRYGGLRRTDKRGLGA